MPPPENAPINVQMVQTDELCRQWMRKYSGLVEMEILKVKGHTNHVHFDRSLTAGMEERTCVQAHSVTGEVLVGTQLDAHMYTTVFNFLFGWAGRKKDPCACIVTAGEITLTKPPSGSKYLELWRQLSTEPQVTNLYHLRIHVPLHMKGISHVIGASGTNLHTLYLTVRGMATMEPCFWNLSLILKRFSHLQHLRLDVLGDFGSAVRWLFSTDWSGEDQKNVEGLKAFRTSSEHNVSTEEWETIGRSNRPSV